MEDKDKILNEICNTLVSIEEESFIKNVKEALNLNIDPSEIIDKGIVKGLSIVGEKFASGEFFLVELVGAAEPAQKVVKELLEPELKKKTEKGKGLAGYSGCYDFGAERYGKCRQMH